MKVYCHKRFLIFNLISVATALSNIKANEINSQNLNELDNSKLRVKRDECNSQESLDILKDLMDSFDNLKDALLPLSVRLLVLNKFGNLWLNVFPTVAVTSSLTGIFSDKNCNIKVLFQEVLDKLETIQKDVYDTQSLIECKTYKDSYRQIRKKEHHLVSILKNWHKEKNVKRKLMFKQHFARLCIDRNNGLEKILLDFTFLLKQDEMKNTIRYCIKYETNEFTKWLKDITMMMANLIFLITSCESALGYSFDFNVKLFTVDVANIFTYHSEVTMRQQFMNDNGEFGLVKAIQRVANEARDANDLVSILNSKYAFYNWTAIFYSDDYVGTDSPGHLVTHVKNLYCGSHFYKRELTKHKRNAIVAWNLPNMQFTSVELRKDWFRAHLLDDIHNKIKSVYPHHSFILTVSPKMFDSCPKGEGNFFRDYFTFASNVYDVFIARKYRKDVCVSIGQCGFYQEISMELPVFRENPILIKKING